MTRRSPSSCDAFRFAACCSAAAALPASAQDATALAGFNVSDALLSYRATGVVQNSKANNLNPPASIDGTLERLPPDVQVNGPFWWFEIAHDAQEVTAAKLKGVRLKLQGEHVRAPHAAENNNNPLTLVYSDAVDIDAGKSVNLIITAGVPHPAKEDIDYYGAGARATNVTIGAATTVKSQTEVTAKHGPYEPPPEKDKGTTGHTSAGGTRVAYDPATRALTLLLGPIDVLDAEGGRSGGIAPEFASDALLSCVTTIAPFSVGPQNDDGSWPLSPTEYHSIDPSPAQALDVRIATLDSSFLPGAPIRFVAPNARGFYDGDPDSNEFPSPWTHAFTQTVLLGVGDPLWPRRSVVLTIECDDDLAAATLGFEARAELPCSVFLSGTGPGPFGCDADWNADDTLDAFDYDDFVSEYFNFVTAGIGFPDFNQDGTVDAFDYDDFVNAFFTGC